MTTRLKHHRALASGLASRGWAWPLSGPAASTGRQPLPRPTLAAHRLQPLRHSRAVAVAGQQGAAAAGCNPWLIGWDPALMLGLQMGTRCAVMGKMVVSAADAVQRGKLARPFGLACRSKHGTPGRKGTARRSALAPHKRRDCASRRLLGTAPVSLSVRSSSSSRGRGRTNPKGAACGGSTWDPRPMLVAIPTAASLGEPLGPGPQAYGQTMQQAAEPRVCRTAARRAGAEGEGQACGVARARSVPLLHAGEQGRCGQPVDVPQEDRQEEEGCGQDDGVHYGDEYENTPGHGWAGVDEQGEGDVPYDDAGWDAADETAEAQGHDGDVWQEPRSHEAYGSGNILDAFLTQVRQDGELNAQRAGQERIASLRKAAFQNKFRGGGRGRGVRGKVAGKRPAKAARGDGAGAAKQGGGGAGGSGRGRGAAGCTGGSSAVGILRFAKASAVR